MKDDVIKRSREDADKLDDMIEQHTSGGLKSRTIQDGRLVDTTNEDVARWEANVAAIRADISDLENS